eukprot:768546-Hanusia_phi.AAC.2
MRLGACHPVYPRVSARTNVCYLPLRSPLPKENKSGDAGRRLGSLGSPRRADSRAERDWRQNET